MTFLNEISMINVFNDYILGPLPETPSLTASVVGQDQEGAKITTSVVIERPLTIFLNSQEIVTVMTVGDYPDMLAVGFLLNQNMLKKNDKVSKVSIVGAGMVSTPGVTYKMFQALANKKINIQVITTSEIKISILIDEEHTDLAVQKLHQAFKLHK